MSNIFHDTPMDSTRRNGICCGNASNVLSTTKAHRSAKISTGTDLQKGANGICEAQNGDDHKIEISPECLNLLGDVIFAGMLAPDKKNSKETAAKVQVLAKLTKQELVWGSKTLKFADIVSVSHVLNTRRFTIHSFPFEKSRWPCKKIHCKRKDLHFLAPRPDEASRWVAAFQSLNCFANYMPQPLPLSKRQGSTDDANNSPSDDVTSCQSGRVMLVILNPRSGRGGARKIYDQKVEPLLKLAGIKVTVLETNGPHNAQKLAAEADLSTCTDGIICVGGDGIVNEVLNGLLDREDRNSSSIPIGIIPAGSDNSLIWTIMGIRDPASAAMAIVKGGLISTDVISVDFTGTGDSQMGHTITYYGFMSEVLELSEKYQKKFGPLRYFVAGAMKFLCLPGYECEVEYLPAVSDQERTDVKEVCSDATLCHFDEPMDIETVSRFFNGDAHTATLSKSGMDHDILGANIDANNEPSEFVRALDTKSKRSLTMRGPIQSGSEEAVAVNHSVAGARSPSPRPRTRSKARIDRGWSGSYGTNGINARGSWDYSTVDLSSDSHSALGEEFSTSLGAKWAAQQEMFFDLNHGADGGSNVASKRVGQNSEEKWVVKQARFLGVMICNHKCKTVQCLESQTMAPSAEHDDRTLDLVMVRKVGRLRLLQFLVLMQFGRHLSLPFVEYTKVQSVKLKPGNKSHKYCGIDGELVPLDGPITVTLLEDQHQLIGHSAVCT